MITVPLVPASIVFSSRRPRTCHLQVQDQCLWSQNTEQSSDDISQQSRRAEIGFSLNHFWDLSKSLLYNHQILNFVTEFHGPDIVVRCLSWLLNMDFESIGYRNQRCEQPRMVAKYRGRMASGLAEIKPSCSSHADCFLAEVSNNPQTPSSRKELTGTQSCDVSYMLTLTKR